MIWHTIYEPPKEEGPPKYSVTGVYAHYCNDWDGLAVSEFTPEFSCCQETWSGWRGWFLSIAQWLNRKYWQWEERQHYKRMGMK